MRVWSTLTVLRHSFPAPGGADVVVELKSLDCEGRMRDETGDKGRFLIEINSDLEESAWEEILVHEYAHVLTSNYEGPLTEAVWGVCYSGLYSLIFGDH